MSSSSVDCLEVLSKWLEQIKRQKYDFISLLRGSSWQLLLPVYHFNSILLRFVLSSNHSKYIYMNLQYLYDSKWYLAICITIENNNWLSFINVTSLFLKQNTQIFHIKLCNYFQQKHFSRFLDLKCLRVILFENMQAQEIGYS